MEEALGLSAAVRERFAPILKAIREQAGSLANTPDLVSIRPGFASDAVTPAVVLGFRPPLSSDAEAIREKLADSTNVAVAAREASPADQLRWQAQSLAKPIRDLALERWYEGVEVAAFAPPTRGTYEPPSGPGSPTLDPVDDVMKVTFCASPDAGWPVLEEFLSQPVDERMSIGMYQFTAPHVYQRLRKTLLDDADSELRLTMHPVPEEIPSGGTKADDTFGPVLVSRLRKALGGRFAFAWTDVRKGGTFPSSYHIKVAVADRKRMWLSSGNWQSSNLPPFDPIDEPEELPSGFHRSYNREYHVAIEHAGLADTFDRFLGYDLAMASGKPVDFGDIEVLAPLEVELPADFAPPRFFSPLQVNRRVRVQPILTPDNYPRHVLALLASAQRSVYFQNQYINLNVQEDFPEFRRLVAMLGQKIEDGLDVKIICRDLMEQDKVDMLLALGFPREAFRFLTGCHNKTIIVDGERILLGSHNWSNEGTVENRDASLLFDDEEIALYYTDIFKYDWDRATASPKRKKPRLVRAGESFAVPMQRTSLSALYDDGVLEMVGASAGRGRPAMPAAGPGAAAAAGAATGGAPAAVVGGGQIEAFGATVVAAATAPPAVQLSGVDGSTGRYLNPATSVSDLLKAARISLAAEPEEVKAARVRSEIESFGLPFGVDRNDLTQSGWGIVFAQDCSPAIRQAFDPLIAHRRALIGDKLVKVLEYRNGETVRSWLTRHGVGMGIVMPRTVPYHLLLVGTPSTISYAFQFLLDLEYSVGRVWFDEVPSFARYASSVVAYETGPVANGKEIVYFGPSTSGDSATKMSSEKLVSPLEKGDASADAIAKDLGYRSRLLLGPGATRSALLGVLGGQGSRPACLFTAGHGIGYSAGHIDQRARQGALLTQDWTGPGDTNPNAAVAASDIADDAKVHGLVAFFFACYGAGTPQIDLFPMTLDTPPAAIAPNPFVAALPNRLLGHPGGGALGVFGHIERAWGFSIQPPGVQAQIQPFRNALGTILHGDPLGNASKDFGDRYAVLSTELLDALRPGAPPVDESELVVRWLERNDAGSYVLLGDPAARVRVGELS